MSPPSVPPPLPRALHRARNRPGAPPERSWTPVGTVDAGVLAVVDDSGLVHRSGTTWSLDWWIGAEDRWHHPSVEVPVRRFVGGSAPVVETAMRVPGGDVVARAFGVRARAGEWGGPGVVVEVENRTAVPVALALVLRPVRPDGEGALDTVRVDGEVALVGSRPALLADRVPRRVLTAAAGTLADALAADSPDAEVPPAAAGGPVEVALVLPLAHSATVRALLPVAGTPRGLRRSSAPVPGAPWDAPDADSVVSGWRAHTRGGLGVVVPEPDWDGGVAWADATLRLAGPEAVGELLDRDRPAPPGADAALRAAAICEALAATGAADAAAVVADALAGVQRRGGEVRMGDGSDGAVALLWSVGAVLAGPSGGARAEELLAPAAAAIARLRREVDRGRSRDADGAASAARALVPGLLAVGQPEVAEDALALDRAPAAGSAPQDRGVASVDGVRSTFDLARGVRRSVRSRLPAAHQGLRDLWVERTHSGRADAVDGDGHPVGASGFDSAELAERVLALVDALVLDGPRGPDLLPSFPEAWRGAQVEVSGVRTAWGTVGAALRWHGDRPALLWEVEPAPGLDPATSAPLVRCPGLDPSWEAAGWSGEALLAPPAAPRGGPAPDAGGAGSDPLGEGQSFS